MFDHPTIASDHVSAAAALVEMAEAAQAHPVGAADDVDKDDEVTYVETCFVPLSDTERARSNIGPHVAFQLRVQTYVTPILDMRSLRLGELVDAEGGTGLHGDWFEAFRRKVLRPLLRTCLRGNSWKIGGYVFHEWDVKFAVRDRRRNEDDNDEDGWSDLDQILLKLDLPYLLRQRDATTIRLYVTLQGAAREDILGLKGPEPRVPVLPMQDDEAEEEEEEDELEQPSSTATDAAPSTTTGPEDVPHSSSGERFATAEDGKDGTESSTPGCVSTSTPTSSVANVGQQGGPRLRIRVEGLVVEASDQGVSQPPPLRSRAVVQPHRLARVHRHGKQPYEIGTKVCMEFSRSGWFWGEVYARNSHWYHVAWEDGDRLRLPPKEMHGAVQKAKECKISDRSAVSLATHVLRAQRNEPKVVDKNYRGEKEPPPLTTPTEEPEPQDTAASSARVLVSPDSGTAATSDEHAGPGQTNPDPVTEPAGSIPFATQDGGPVAATPSGPPPGAFYPGAPPYPWWPWANPSSSATGHGAEPSPPYLPPPAMWWTGGGPSANPWAAAAAAATTPYAFPAAPPPHPAWWWNLPPPPQAFGSTAAAALSSSAAAGVPGPPWWNASHRAYASGAGWDPSNVRVAPAAHPPGRLQAPMILQGAATNPGPHRAPPASAPVERAGDQRGVSLGAQPSSTATGSAMDNVTIPKRSGKRPHKSASPGSCKRCCHKVVAFKVMRKEEGVPHNSPRTQDLSVKLSVDAEAFDPDEFSYFAYAQAAGIVSRLLDRGKIRVVSNGADRPLIQLGGLGGKWLMITHHKKDYPDGRMLQLSVDCTAHRSVRFFQITLLFCPSCGRLLEMHWNGVLDPLLPPPSPPSGSSAPNVEQSRRLA